MAKGSDDTFAGFTSKEMDRMAKTLSTNHATLRRYIRTLGLACMTTAAATKAIREYRTTRE
ncbi:hypothetical protein EVC24_131 [Rhizobium phage RHph_I4]|nr:hypothetical protein EVC24_131 [Rhizobium phage RHph_I4]